MTKPSLLILCTGNSCRSHLAEGILHSVAGNFLEVHSAGSKPAGYVHPLGIKAMAEIGIDISAHTSKYMNDFLTRDVETVITVCGNAAQETCPVWPGHPSTAHWALPDPAHVEPIEARREAFETAYQSLRRRIEAFVALPLHDLQRDRARLKQELDRIGEQVR